MYYVYNVDTYIMNNVYTLYYVMYIFICIYVYVDTCIYVHIIT